jgi:hypothetical protein
MSAYTHVSEAAVSLVQIVLPEVIDYYLETRTDKALEQIKEVGHSWRSNYSEPVKNPSTTSGVEREYTGVNASLPMSNRTAGGRGDGGGRWRGGDGEEAAAGSSGRGDCEEVAGSGYRGDCEEVAAGSGGLHGEEAAAVFVGRRRCSMGLEELALPRPKWKKRVTPLASGKPVDPMCFSDFSQAYTATNRATKWTVKCIFE